MGKGEIARYEQFLLYPQCFQNACFPGASKGVFVWEWAEWNSCSDHPYKIGHMQYFRELYHQNIRVLH